MKSTLFSIATCLFLVGLLCLFGVACSAPGSEPAEPQEAVVQIAEATPAPTAEPVTPVVAVFGGDRGFEEVGGLLSQVRDAEIADGTQGIPEHTAVAFFYLDNRKDVPEISSLADNGIPVVVYNRIGFECPDDAVTVGYTEVYGSDRESVMEDAIAYPPHDTPVRMFGVFPNEESEAFQLFQDMISEGKILRKGLYLGPADSAYMNWIERKLDAFLEGMLDCAYVETAEEAAVLANALIERGRDDFEIFTDESGEELASLAEAYPRIFPHFMRFDDDGAMEESVNLINSILAGEAVEDVLLDG